jgi:hypothetical protein
MAFRLASRSNGRGPALSALVAEWAARNPKIRRVWACGASDALALELQPVGDSEETFPVWLANCERWRSELAARVGRPVDLEWLDPDGAALVVQPRPGEADTLIYERSG